MPVRAQGLLVALRFTDTKKWTDDEWFMELDPNMKCLWLYLCDMCDHAGIWKVNFKQASFSIKALLDKQSAMNAFGLKVIPLAEDKWFIPSFIRFQYRGGLKKNNSTHRGVFKLLVLNNIDSSPFEAPSEDLERTSEGSKDTDKDKDKDKNKDQDQDKDKDSIKGSKKGDESQNSTGPKLVKKITPDEVVDLWNQTLARNGFKAVPGLGSGEHLKNCLEAIKWLPTRESWSGLFDKVKASKFLSGENDRNWKVPLTWLVDYDHALRILSDEFEDGCSDPFANMKSKDVPA